MRAWPGPATAGFRRRLTASWTAVTGTGAAASLALASLVLICSFVAVAVPRASLGYRTQVLQRIFHGASSASTTVLADADIAGLNQGYLDEAQLNAARGQLLAGLRRDSLPLAPPGADWSGMVTGSVPFSVPGGRRPPPRAPPSSNCSTAAGWPVTRGWPPDPCPVLRGPVLRGPVLRGPVPGRVLSRSR